MWLGYTNIKSSESGYEHLQAIKPIDYLVIKLLEVKLCNLV